MTWEETLYPLKARLKKLESLLKAIREYERPTDPWVHDEPLELIIKAAKDLDEPGKEPEP